MAKDDQFIGVSPENVEDIDTRTILDILLDENSNDNITMFDEDGKEVVFEQVAVIPHEDQIYAILHPVDEIEGVSEDEAIVFRVDYDDDQLPFLLVESDEGIATAVFDKYVTLLESEECDGDCSSCGGSCGDCDGGCGGCNNSGND